jgi:hypothetical protein
VSLSIEKLLYVSRIEIYVNRVMNFRITRFFAQNTEAARSSSPGQSGGYNYIKQTPPRAGFVFHLK